MKVKVNILKIQTHKKIAVIILKFERCGFTTVMHPKDADRMTNSVDPEQTAQRRSTLFAQTCLSKTKDH